MASICPTSFPAARTDSSLNQLGSYNFRLSSTKNSSIYNIPRTSDSSLCCRCHGEGSQSRPWEFDIQETLKNAIKGFDDFVSSIRDRRVNERSVEKGEADDDVEDWDWERWRKHFEEVEEQERLVSILKSQLARAVKKEDYEEAARIKVAIAASSTSDAVSRVMSYLKKYVEEERYGDAAVLRDYAGAGLVGWWSGISKDGDTSYGRIIRISAEYGRYVARSYSPRQLATASDGSPLFEVYLKNNKRGQYKQQAVYLKRKGASQNLYIPPFMSPSSSRDLHDAVDKKTKLSEGSSEESEDGEGEDDDLSFDDVLKDMIPGVKVKVVKVTAPDKVDAGMISNAIEQIIDEEDEEEKDYDLEDDDDEDEDGNKSENNEEHDAIELDSVSEIRDEDVRSQIAVEFVLGDGLIPRMSRDKRSREIFRVPARLENNDRFSFTFTVEEDDNERAANGGDVVGNSPKNKPIKLQSQGSMDNVMLDLVKSIGKGKIPMKVLKDVSELINLTINQSRNRQPLSGSTTFNRLVGSSSTDPLNGLYIGAHGLYTSEVIHMKRRFGQWKDDGKLKNSPPKLEFYEYVEAVKLTGEAYVPAGQVAFRAKIGKSYELPHKGIIPEEFGVIARYKGQGRMAEPGFRNPKWVDGELVILDGKYIKGGPVVGFVYWAPEYHFLVFFNRLRLHD